MAGDLRDARKSILCAAREGFALKGYYGTSMDSIVKTTGLSKGAIYWHFPGNGRCTRRCFRRKRSESKDCSSCGNAGEVSATDGVFHVERRAPSLLADDAPAVCFVHLMLEAMLGSGDGEFVASLRAPSPKMYSSSLNSSSGRSLQMHALSHRDLVSMFRVFHGLIMNLELTVSRDEAKKSWRFLIGCVFGGISHES